MCYHFLVAQMKCLSPSVEEKAVRGGNASVTVFCVTTDSGVINHRNCLNSLSQPRQMF